MLKFYLLTFLTLGCILTLTLVLEALANPGSVTSGIAVLQFNATALIQDLSESELTIPLPGVVSQVESAASAAALPSVISEARSAATAVVTVLPSVVSEARSAASAVVTALPSVVSEARSAASAAATAAAGIVKAAIPQNCSIGSKKFCVGRAGAVSCHSLPLNLTDLFSSSVAASLQGTFGDFRELDTALSTLTAPYVLFVTGLVLTVVQLGLFCLSAYDLFPPSMTFVIKLLIGTTGLLLIATFLASTAILFVVKTKLKNLPAWIRVEQGHLAAFSLVCLCFAVVLTVASIVAILKRSIAKLFK